MLEFITLKGLSNKCSLKKEVVQLVRHYTAMLCLVSQNNSSWKAY